MDLSLGALRGSTVEAVSPQESNGLPDMKDDEFKGDDQVQKAMKGMLLTQPPQTVPV